jgi:hypothetical protein
VGRLLNLQPYLTHPKVYTAGDVTHYFTFSGDPHTDIPTKSTAEYRRELAAKHQAASTRTPTPPPETHKRNNVVPAPHIDSGMKFLPVRDANPAGLVQSGRYSNWRGEEKRQQEEKTAALAAVMAQQTRNGFPGSRRQQSESSDSSSSESSESDGPPPAKKMKRNHKKVPAATTTTKTKASVKKGKAAQKQSSSDGSSSGESEEDKK